MAIVLQNRHIVENVFSLRVLKDEDSNVPFPGQFYMLRTWEDFPLLSRPFSVFDLGPDASTIDFVYQVVGKGTDMLSHIAEGSNIQLDGPYGHGFPDHKGDLVIISGGIGLAPLYYAASRHKELYPNSSVRAYLGFSSMPYFIEKFEDFCEEVTYDIGNYITDYVTVFPDETVFCCGPEAMMRKLGCIVPAQNSLYFSFERYMACGLGACLGCVETIPNNYRSDGMGGLQLIPAMGKRFRVCTDGPVFKRQVFK